MEMLSPKKNEIFDGILRTTIAKQADEETVMKQMVVFSDLCSRMLCDITQKKTIQERSLLDFSKVVIWVVNNFVEELPKSFNELADYISDYWRYESNKEQDSEREYSYIRLYQMINIIRIHYKECELEDKAFLALEKYEANTELLHLIQHTPGITHKKLRTMLNITSVELREQLKLLEKDGFLYSRRFDEEQYYLLTNVGEILYQKLKLKKKISAFSGIWSDKRKFVFLFIFIYQQNIDTLQLLELVEKIGKCNNDLISRIRKKIISNFLMEENILGLEQKKAFFLLVKNMKTLTHKQKYYPKLTNLVCWEDNESHYNESHYIKENLQKNS